MRGLQSERLRHTLLPDCDQVADGVGVRGCSPLVVSVSQMFSKLACFADVLSVRHDTVHGAWL